MWRFIAKLLTFFDGISHNLTPLTPSFYRPRAIHLEVDSGR